ncbi:hypothetical protein BKA56DRAFT_226280 [Ilyonectria sp. MPI-CAGE-AT-0026]|nr:hypothetical protein BKA56DRAFT_226280 [Ilyonectria sp. MPI-CAGE-AT-0026]
MRLLGCWLLGCVWLATDLVGWVAVLSRKPTLSLGDSHSASRWVVNTVSRARVRMWMCHLRGDDGAVPLRHCWMNFAWGQPPRRRDWFWKRCHEMVLQ